MNKKFSFTAILLFGAIFFSCSDNDGDLDEINERRRTECLEYSFSNDSLSLKSLWITVNDSTTKYLQSEIGLDLLGTLKFKQDTFALWYRVIPSNSVDTIELRMTGLYDYEFLRIEERSCSFGSKSYDLYNSINFYSSEEGISDLLNVKQQVYCHVVPGPTQELIFTLNKVDYRLRYTYID